MTKPIYFMVSFWGERFRQLFLETCLPSLGDISRHRLVIACPAADWWDAGLNSDPRLANSTHIELVNCWTDQPDAVKFRQMNDSHRLLLNHVHRCGGLASQIMPDAIYSPGTVSYLEDRAKKGDHAVLVPAFRLDAEGLMIDRDYRLPARSCLVRNLWPTYERYDWDAREFAKWPNQMHWRPGLESLWPTTMEGQQNTPAANDELLFHTTNFAYVLLDLSVPQKLDHSSFDEGLCIENRWLSDNFKDLSKIHVVQDESVLILCGSPREKYDPPPSSRASFLRKGYRLRRMREVHRRTGDHIKADVLRYRISYGRLRLPQGTRPINDPAYYVMRRYFGDVFREFARAPTYRNHMFWFLLRTVIWFDLTARDCVRACRKRIGHLRGDEHYKPYAHRPAKVA
jgi:hypothetical protein